jgi:hypothetical protein
VTEGERRPPEPVSPGAEAVPDPDGEAVAAAGPAPPPASEPALEPAPEPAPAQATEPVLAPGPALERAPAQATEPALEPAPDLVPVPAPAPPPAEIPLVPTSRLLAASFDLLGRSGTDMRRASFYIGLIVLGTVGPLALASWGVLVIEMERGFTPFEGGSETNVDAPLAGLGLLAFVGLVVAWVESRSLAITVLGGRMVERPVSTRRALARSRRVFWSAILASFIAGIPVLFVQGTVDSFVAPMFGFALEASVITSTLVTALIGGPFAYVLAGVVLGDVDPFEALRRSFRVFRARKLAAAIVVVFETITALLVLLGIETGLDVVLRLFDGLGLGPEAGTVGLAMTTIGVVAVTFAFGTLIFTVTALTVAPQVVMFLGLTHATMGLDRVRPGGPDDPDIRQPGRPRFRWLTRSMLLGFVLGAVGLALAVATLAG